MVSSAPSITFNPSSVSFGVIDVDNTTANTTFHIRNKGAGSYATAKNCSLSFVESANASECRNESWVYCSSADEAAYMGSIGGTEVGAPSVIQSYTNSIVVATKAKVPATPTTSGTVLYKYHFRYQYTG